MAYRDDPWVKSNHAPTGLNMTYNYRIHPNDSHLQYGPISTALRERAGLADRNALALVELEAGSYIIYDEYYYQYINCDHRTTRQTYLLLMAEALADEGL